LASGDALKNLFNDFKEIGFAGTIGADEDV
jgi:hypothetical protein